MHSSNNANIDDKKWNLNKKVIINIESIGNSHKSFVGVESYIVNLSIASYRKKVSSEQSNSLNQLSSQKVIRLIKLYYP